MSSLCWRLITHISSSLIDSSTWMFEALQSKHLQNETLEFLIPICFFIVFNLFFSYWQVCTLIYSCWKPLNHLQHFSDSYTTFILSFYLFLLTQFLEYTQSLTPSTFSAIMHHYLLLGILQYRIISLADLQAIHKIPAEGILLKWDAENGTTLLSNFLFLSLTCFLTHSHSKCLQGSDFSPSSHLLYSLTLSLVTIYLTQAPGLDSALPLMCWACFSKVFVLVGPSCPDIYSVGYMYGTLIISSTFLKCHLSVGPFVISDTL
jgi:hypothetical protein